MADGDPFHFPVDDLLSSYVRIEVQYVTVTTVLYSVQSTKKVDASGATFYSILQLILWSRNHIRLGRRTDV
jgi:hypothetical protein